MDSLDFSEEEIQEQLAALGYKNIPKHRLLEFKKDLAELIRCGEWRNFASSTQMNSKSQEATSRQGPPAFTKEKVGQCYFDGSSEQFFLHADKADHDRYGDCGQQKGHCDSYAQHTVAAKLQLPPGAPTRLHVEPDLENSLQSAVSDSYSSSPDSHGRRFIKRKVLRKHKGQSFVCDESVYSEDSAPLPLQITLSGGVHVATMYKMYDSQWDKDSDDDKNSLSSSFWSDGEKQDKEEEEEEEKEEVLIQRGTDSRPVNNAEDSPKEAPEEKAELNNQKNVTTKSLEEEEVQIERFINFKPVNNAEDPHKEASEEEKSEQDKQGTSTADSYQEESDDDDDDEDEQDAEDDFYDEVEEEEEEVDDEEEDDEQDEEDCSDDEKEEDGEDEEEDEEEEEEVQTKGVIDSKPDNNGEEEDEEEEEEVQTKGVIDSKPDNNGEDSLVDGPEEERSVLKNQGSITGESLKENSEEQEEEEGCSTSSDSPAPSFMTSGYGTYRPEEGGDYRDDHTITEFDQDSRGDLSEMRDDDEDNRSLCSFVEFDIEPTHEADFSETAVCVFDIKPEEDAVSADENPEEDLYAASEDEGANGSLEEQQPHAVAAEEKLLLNKDSKDGSDIKEDEKTEEEQGFHKMKIVEKEAEESEDPDESSSNKDIKFIDSKVDFSWMTYDKMCVEWEGNLRQKKDAASCLEEQLSELQISTSAPQDSEAEDEDVRDHSDTQSSETDGISLSAFESYIRGMTRTRSDGDLRPRHKSFIRPVMSQQTIKKTDPVAKYFQYKQLWNMFKLPGEKDRRALRWEIKERLAYQPPPPKPRKVYAPNTYIVPTEKKRSALRWEVRNDLANGLLPHKLGYRF